jgi:zinc/manganese transport system permease protein
VLVPLLSVCFAVVSTVGGILLALGGSIPISPYVTTISFAIYLACRLIATGRRRRSHRATRPGGPRRPSPVTRS